MYVVVSLTILSNFLFVPFQSFAPLVTLALTTQQHGIWQKLTLLTNKHFHFRFTS